MASTVAHERIAAVRRFNRFYTRRIGALAHGHLGSRFSLTEARVLWELAHRETSTASGLSADLGVDPGYLSRILASFARRRLLHRRASAADGRRSQLSLTALGRKAFGALDARARADVNGMLGALPARDQRRLLAALGVVEEILAPPAASRDAYVLRPPRAGDLGWVVHRHGALYHEEYGFDERFEALVAEIVAQFVASFNPRHDRCWIAEQDGANVGSVFVVRKTRTVAKLRLLLVEPDARGLGLGKRLVDECIAFARQAGYRTLTLWTQRNLRAARHLYQRAGFRLVGQKPHRDFGPPLVAETWELDLRAREKRSSR